MNNSKSLPMWLLAICWIFFVSNLFVFGLIPFFNPAFAFPFPEETSVAGAFPIRFFAIRHIAFAVPLLHGTITQDVRILRAVFTMFLVMTVLDIAVVVLNPTYYIPVIEGFVDFPGWGTLLFGLAFFILPVSLVLSRLHSEKV